MINFKTIDDNEIKYIIENKKISINVKNVS